MAWRFAVLAIADVASGRNSFDPDTSAATDAVSIDGPSIDAAPGAWLGGFTRRKAIEAEYVNLTKPAFMSIGPAKPPGI